MADQLMDEPYFYLSFYALDGGQIDYTKLPSLKQGRWEISDGFKGAVLGLSELQGCRWRKAKQRLNEFTATALELVR